MLSHKQLLSLKKSPNTTIQLVMVGVWLLVLSLGVDGQGFMLRGVSYSDGDTVILSDIGEGENGLRCITTQTDCCGQNADGMTVPAERRGDFYYPNGTLIPTRSRAGGDGLFRGRGYQSIILQRLSPATTTSPPGLYRCHILDRNGVSQNMFINIDINECTVRTEHCVDDATCVNTDGSFTCICPIGFKGDGRVSPDGTECTVDVSIVSTGKDTVGEQYFLTCTVTSDDTHTFTWNGPPNGGPLPSDNNDTRMVSDSSSGSTHTSILQFDPLLLLHGGSYTCQVILGTVLYTESIQVNVKEPVITVMVSGGTPTVGESYSLTCTVTGADQLNPTITYRWIKDNTVISGETQSILSFSSLSQLDAGQYRCDVNVSSTLLIRNILTSNHHFQIIVPTPVITAMVSGGTPTVGESYSLTCTVTGAVRLYPTIAYQWFKNNTEVSGETQSTLSFSSLSLSDAGQYRCDVTVGSALLNRDIANSSNPIQLVIPSVLFQIRMNGIPNCHKWALTNTATKIHHLLTTLVQAVEQECECGFTREHITEDAFQCFPESQQHVTFRARLSETTQASTQQLIAYIKQWAIASKIIAIRQFRLGINNTCDTVVNDYYTPECPPKYKNTFSEQTLATAVFQLKFGQTDHCITWNGGKAQEIQSSIRDEVLQAINSRCRCELPKENVLPGTFTCLDSHNQTTYRSTIIGTHSYNATELVEFIQGWVTSGPTLTIQWYTVKLDQKCPVSIPSLGDPECGQITEKKCSYRDDPNVAQCFDVIAACIARRG